MTDTRARAKELLSDLTDFIEVDGGYCNDHIGAMAVTIAALADERRKALEEAATVYEDWVAGKWFDEMEFQDALRAQAQAGPEEGK